MREDAQEDVDREQQCGDLCSQGGWGRPLSGGDAGPGAQLTQRIRLCNTLREQCSQQSEYKR